MRQDAPVTRPWIAMAAVAGAVAGIIYGPLEAGLVAVAERTSYWTLPHRIAGMVMGGEIVTRPIAPVTVGTGWALHMALAMAFGFAIVAPARRFQASAGVPLGAAIGLVIYLVSYHLIAPVLFPWMMVAQGAHTAIMHMVFGVITMRVYGALQRRLDRVRASSSVRS